MGGVPISDKKTIADKFNRYFSSIAENLNKTIEIKRKSVRNFTTYLPNSENSSMFLEDTDPDEIVDIIKEFDNHKSSDIPIFVIKHCALTIAPILCSLYNHCMKDGIFPSILKFGKISSVFKKGSKDKIENYRPISTLPIFGKIFEKILYKRVYSFVTSRNIISENQFGFRANHSTSHAIHNFVNFIKSSHAKGKHVLGVFIISVKHSTQSITKYCYINCPTTASVVIHMISYRVIY